jgi:hypothetical protein
VTAYEIWEADGPGRTFGRTVMESGYANYYCDRSDVSRKLRVGDNPGWKSTSGKKKDLLFQYGEDLGADRFVNHSEEALRQCRQYVYTPSRDVKHSKAATSQDPSGKDENHGDIVIADALANRGLREVPEVTEHTTGVPWGSLAWRRREDEAAAKAAQASW